MTPVNQINLPEGEVVADLLSRSKGKKRSLVEADRPPDAVQVVRLEPADRLVALARTLDATSSATEAELKQSSAGFARFGENCIGAASYRHRSVFQGASTAEAWSHFELIYFRDLIPIGAIRELVLDPQPAAFDLLRAEILVTTPSSFVLPRDWRGNFGSPERVASLEFLDVGPTHLGEYRNAMRDYCGPAAQKLVRSRRFGTFRAMETAAILHQAPELSIEWNQVHLCELDPEDFNGFGEEFAKAHRQDAPEESELPDAFADLGRLRTIPRWTFNDPVIEADTSVARVFGAD